MEPRTRRASVLLLVLGILLGVTGVALGGVNALSCTSGYELGLERLEPNETSPDTTETVTYEELSPESQRVFIDAHSAIQQSETNRGYSGVYTDQSRVSPLSGMVVLYQGDRYYGRTTVVDCGPSLAGIPLVGGAILFLIGGVPLALEYAGQS